MANKKLFLVLVPLAAIMVAGGVLWASANNFLVKIPGCPCINFETASGEFEPGEKKAFFEGKEITFGLAFTEIPQVLGEENGLGTGKEKWVEVDLSEQKIRAWEGEQLFLESPISSGKWAPTPKGEYRIWIKFHYAKMEGGKKGTGTYYYLPNVPYIMYFYKGFGLHGTYWHNNFGQPMSHGCVNLPTPVAEKLYYWTTPSVPSDQHQVRATTENPGTRVVIHE